MKKSTAYKSRPASISNRAAGSLPWSYFVVIAICGCVIAAGFLLAARQHFLSMDLGMKNSKLRKQLEDVESENRRLTLAREVAISPVEITRTARSLGFAEVFNASSLTSAPPVAPNASATALKASATKSNSVSGSAAVVAKTSISRPSGPATPSATAGVSAKQAPGSEISKPKYIKPDMTAVAKLR